VLALQSIPVLALQSIPGRLRFGAAHLRRTKSTRIASLKKQIASEFNFERAIEAYEELIDATFAEGRP
jgi:hypothetical protein